jgi:acyl carrier protein
MSSDIRDMGLEELRQILIEDIGIEAEALSDDPDAALSDLGMDSIAQVELGVVLRGRFGVEELPEDASAMSLAELAGAVRDLPVERAAAS